MTDRRTHLEQADPEVFAMIQREVHRQEEGLELIASENFTSRAVMDAAGTELTNKYAEGLPGKRYYGGCQFVDQVEQLAIDRVKQIFGAEHANVQPHSGAQANMAAYMAVVKAGETIMGLKLTNGGHLTHGAAPNFSGQLYRSVQYEVDTGTGRIDMDKVRDLAKQERPKLIIAGGSAYPRIIDFPAFAAIAKEVEALFLVDMAHFAGLVAAGVHPSPVPHAEVVTSTTHKTLRGPRGGFILCREPYAKAVDKQVFPGTQGGPLEHIIAAKAVAFGEVLQPSFKTYAVQVVKNAKAMCEELLARGYALASGGTDTHLLLVDLRSRNLTGKAAEEALQKADITVNKNTIPGDPQSPFVTSGIRIGTPALTTRGMREDEMKKIAGMIDTVLSSPDEATIAKVRSQVRDLTAGFPLYQPVEVAVP